MGIPTPPLPEPLVYVLWTLGVLAALLVFLRRARRMFAEDVDERFRIAIQGKTFQGVVDERVTTAFDGALRPLMSANHELAAKIQTAKDSADAAHRRIDRYFEKKLSKMGTPT
jgi:hypothetical protein